MGDQLLAILEWSQNDAPRASCHFTHGREMVLRDCNSKAQQICSLFWCDACITFDPPQITYQQDYGVLTTFGGLLNFAYNAKLKQDTNLTFGLNIAAYKSGVNTSNIVTNFDAYCIHMKGIERLGLSLYPSVSTIVPDSGK